MANKVDQLEAEASAQVELEDLSGTADLEKQFKELEKGKVGSDLMLEDLKAKMKAQEAGSIVVREEVGSKNS